MVNTHYYGVTVGTGASDLFTVIDLFDKVNNDSSIDILDLLKSKDTGKTSDEKMLNKLMEKASNYSISSASDLNKVIVDGGKKFRIMKVATNNIQDKGENEKDLSKGFRNIKLKVDANGKKRVTNMFKFKRRAKYPYLVRRKNRQIYRGEYNNHKARAKQEKVTTDNKQDNSEETGLKSFPQISYKLI